MIFLQIFKAISKIILFPITIANLVRCRLVQLTKNKPTDNWTDVKQHVDLLHEKARQLIDTAKTYRNIGMLDDSKACFDEADTILKTAKSLLEAERNKGTFDV